jgi:hypothetical protein
MAQSVIPTLISVSSNGNGSQDPSARYVSISADGNFVAFCSFANNLVLHDKNYTSDIFRKNLKTGLIEPVSITATGTFGAADCQVPSMSSNGRFVVFTSNSNNLDSKVSSAGGPSVFVKDMVTGQLECVSVSTGRNAIHGGSYNPSVSDDGRYVTFESAASDVVPNDTNNAMDVFLYDRMLKITRRISVAPDGTQANGPSIHGQISPDGNYAVFNSDATNLVPNDTNRSTDVFVVTLQTTSRSKAGTIQRVSIASTGGQANAGSFDPTINADGSVVAFVSWATNLDGPSPGACIYTRDLISGKTALVSKYSNGAAASSSWLPSISSTGRYVVFKSGSSISTKDTNNSDDIYRYDRQLGTSTLCSLSSSGVLGSRRTEIDFGRRNITADGRYVTFTSPSPELDPTKNNDTWDAYLRDVTLNKTKRVSAAPSGTETGGGASLHPSMSADGRYVVYSSYGSNLVANDPNDASDVFLYDRQTKATTMLSVNAKGQPSGWWNGSFDLDICADGSTVCFTSRSDNIVDGHTSAHSDIFVRNLQTHTIKWISGSPSKPNDGDSYNSRISSNGRYVVYTSWSSVIVPGASNGTAQVYQYDLKTGQTILVSKNNAGQPSNGYCDNAVQSADSRYVAFDSYGNNLVDDDNNNCRDVLVRDTIAGVTIRASLGATLTWNGGQANADCQRPWITADGTRIVFDTSANLVPNDKNNFPDVYMRDLRSNKTTLVSTTSSGQPANAWSIGAWISPDGRYVTFASYFSNVVPNDTNGNWDGFRKDLLTGQNIRLTISADGQQGDQASRDQGLYQLTPDGHICLYCSLATNMVPGVKNQDWNIYQAVIK